MSNKGAINKNRMLNVGSDLQCMWLYIQCISIAKHCGNAGAIPYGDI